MVVALLEYSIVTVFAVWAFISVFIVRSAGTVHPTTQWLSFHGTGAGVFGASMIIAVASLSGWDGGIYLNEETSAPEKNPGRGAVLGVALTGLLFLIMYGTYQGVGPSAQLQAHSANAIAWVGQTLAGHGRRQDHVVRRRDLGPRHNPGGHHRHVTGRVLDGPGPGAAAAPRLHQPQLPDPRLRHPRAGRRDDRAGHHRRLRDLGRSAMTTIINTSGVLYSIFYAVTGIAAAWYYRGCCSSRRSNLVMLGLLPLAGAACSSG